MSGRWNNSAGTLGRSFAPSPPVVGMHQGTDGHALHAPVLVLNASYEPINICAARRAIVLVLKGVAVTEEKNGHFLHPARLPPRPFGHPAAGVSPHPPPDAGALAQEHSAARSQHLPILW